MNSDILFIQGGAYYGEDTFVSLRIIERGLKMTYRTDLVIPTTNADIVDFTLAYKSPWPNKGTNLYHILTISYESICHDNRN